MSHDFTVETYNTRRRELIGALAKAEQDYKSAALAAALDESQVASLRSARERVSEVQDQLTALDAALERAGEAAKADEFARLRQDWAATEETVDCHCSDVEGAGDELEPLIEQVSAIVERYKNGYRGIQDACRGHKAVGRTVFERLRGFNLASGKEIDAAKSTVVAMEDLLDQLRSLRGSAAGALSEIKPACVKEEV